jgi:hypothetical protein
LCARLKYAHVTLIPTLTLFGEDRDFDLILKEVKSYADAGGQIMFGTDIGYLTDYAALTKEYEYLGRAGHPAPSLMVAAPPKISLVPQLQPASALWLADRGRLDFFYVYPPGGIHTGVAGGAIGSLFPVRASLFHSFQREIGQ